MSPDDANLELLAVAWLADLRYRGVTAAVCNDVLSLSPRLHMTARDRQLEPKLRPYAKALLTTEDMNRVLDTLGPFDVPQLRAWFAWLGPVRARAAAVIAVKACRAGRTHSEGLGYAYAALTLVTGDPPAHARPDFARAS